MSRAINKIDRLLADFEEAVRDHEANGALSPVDRDATITEYERSKRALKLAIRSLLYLTQGTAK